METKMSMKMETRYFKAPDEVRKFDNGKVELVKFGNGTVGKATFEPGWRWSNDIKPIAKTEWCEAAHFQYLVSGQMHVKMADGTEIDLKPGSVTMIPPGHDGWVVGNEPAVMIDFQGMVDYARKHK
jgi:hypothetical protein